ncbi:hypothetical protein LINPERPRIM_LOCUS6958, partial [Linum perenne]
MATSASNGNSCFSSTSSTFPKYYHPHQSFHHLSSRAPNLHHLQDNDNNSCSKTTAQEQKSESVITRRGGGRDGNHNSSSCSFSSSSTLVDHKKTKESQITKWRLLLQNQTKIA